jgi:hypothetical protein
VKIQKAPNWWSCLPTAFAIALELPVRELIAEIGHDGSELIFPNQPEPYSRRAYHIQELIYPCLKRGYALMIVEAVPILTTEREPDYHPIMFSEGNNHRLMNIMAQFIGVVAGENQDGKSHAAAWDCNLCYDPNMDVPMSEMDFNIREFFALVPIKAT